MLKNKSGSYSCLLLAAGAFFAGLTLVFPKLGFLEWVALVPSALVILRYGDGFSLRKMYRLGLLFFMCYYVVVFHWFVNLYPLEFIDGMTKGAALAVVLAAWLGLSFFQALFGGLLFVLTALVFRTGTARRFPILKPFAAASLWAVYEWTQTLGWFGVPWGRLPIGQSEYIVELQSASLFGSYFVTFLLVTVNFLVAYAILHREKLRVCAVLCASIIAANSLLGVFLMNTGKNTDGADCVRVAVAQGNISSSDKWDSESTQKTLDAYTRCTEFAAMNGAEVVVWPETAIPYTIPNSASMTRYLKGLAKDTGVTILAGVFTENEAGEELNSIIAVTPDGNIEDTVYSKRHLVPFGEYVPMRKLVSTLIPPLAELVMSEGDIVAGDSPNVFSLDCGRIGSIICFDSIYEELTRQSVLDGAQLIALSTNDSWFSDSAALYMHNAQAQLRAIETGRYVIRAANTGVSSIISPKGEVLAVTEPLVEDCLVYDVYMNDSETFYTSSGNLFVYLCVLANLTLLAYEFYKFIVNRQKNVDKVR